MVLLNNMSDTIQGKYNATPPTVRDRQNEILQLDASGNLKVTSATTSALTGAKSSIGATALQLTAASTKCTGVYVKASNANSGTVYVGIETVTAGSADATDGFPIDATEGVFVTIDDPSKLYVIGSTTGQKVFYMITY